MSFLDAINYGDEHSHGGYGRNPFGGYGGLNPFQQGVTLYLKTEISSFAADDFEEFDKDVQEDLTTLETERDRVLNDGRADLDEILNGFEGSAMQLIQSITDTRIDVQEPALSDLFSNG